MTLFANVYKDAFCYAARIPELIKTDCDGDPENSCRDNNVEFIS